MYYMFQPPPFTHINTHMSLSFFSFIQPVVGTLAKFPKWHLFVIKNILFNWQFTGHNGNFHFRLVVIQIYPNSIYSWLLKP